VCGIAGVCGRADEKLLAEMMACIRHRGPDDQGRFHGPNVSLGHTRLSIIDLAGGRQPLFNEDGGVAVVFNGEIYNHRELRAKLERAHAFRTRTDTEVIVHLYEEMGGRCVEELDGMFAFALWDRGRLLLARDRLGIKPLYLARRGELLLFASEMKALAGCDRIETFPPGRTFSPEGGYREFFDLPDFAAPGEVLGEDRLPEILGGIRTRLEAAVVKRLMADVPVGVFLSGGLDSSLVAALMRRHTQELHSFSVGMAGSRDLQYAREAAAHLGTVHHERVYTEEDLRASIPEVIRFLESFDAPLVRSAFPCYFVSRLARECGVKVILSGEGADELLGGYHYLKGLSTPAELFAELREITARLHNTNLQRADRMSMAWGVECRVPFLDVDFLRLAFKIDPGLKLAGEGRPEKWLLRQAFAGLLPERLLWRRKEKFSEGAGSMDLTARLGEELAGDEPLPENRVCRSREELGYYGVFRRFFPEGFAACVGRTGDY
jgi:asparagine synthase (glutamine-hydrolysing)